jgi:hypothetical protein
LAEATDDETTPAAEFFYHVKSGDCGTEIYGGEYDLRDLGVVGSY